MRIKSLLGVSVAIFLSLSVWASAESKDGAKALFSGEVVTETVDVRQSPSGTAAFSGTEVTTETFSTNKPKSSGGAATVQAKNNKKTAPSLAKLATGLSYWLEVVQPNGKTVRATAESRVFKSGEHVRFAFKSNKEGYLYLLSLGSSGRGTVLFPDPRINGGRNIVSPSENYVIPFGEKSFVMDATPGEERVLVFFSETEIGDVRDYFMGNKKNKQIEAQDTQKLYAYAQTNGSKDIVFEEDAVGTGAQPASYIVTKTNDPKSIIFKEIKIRHK